MQAQSGSSSPDAIGEQQLCTESSPAPDYSRKANEGEVAERAKRANYLYKINVLEVHACGVQLRSLI